MPIPTRPILQINDSHDAIEVYWGQDPHSETYEVFFGRDKDDLELFAQPRTNRVEIAKRRIPLNTDHWVRVRGISADGEKGEWSELKRIKLKKPNVFARMHRSRWAPAVAFLIGIGCMALLCLFHKKNPGPSVTGAGMTKEELTSLIAASVSNEIAKLSATNIPATLPPLPPPEPTNTPPAATPPPPSPAPMSPPPTPAKNDNLPKIVARSGDEMAQVPMASSGPITTVVGNGNIVGSAVVYTENRQSTPDTDEAVMYDKTPIQLPEPGPEIGAVRRTEDIEIAPGGYRECIIPEGCHPRDLVTDCGGDRVRLYIDHRPYRNRQPLGVWTVGRYGFYNMNSFPVHVHMNVERVAGGHRR